MYARLSLPSESKCEGSVERLEKFVTQGESAARCTTSKSLEFSRSEIENVIFKTGPCNQMDI